MDNIVHVSNIVYRVLLVANLRNSFSLLADLKTQTPPGFLTMLQLKYNNGSTGIATIKSSSLSVWDVNAGKQHLVWVYRLKISTLETSDSYSMANIANV